MTATKLAHDGHKVDYDGDHCLTTTNCDGTFLVLHWQSFFSVRKNQIGARGKAKPKNRETVALFDTIGLYRDGHKTCPWRPQGRLWRPRQRRTIDVQMHDAVRPQISMLGRYRSSGRGLWPSLSDPSSWFSKLWMSLIGRKSLPCGRHWHLSWPSLIWPSWTEMWPSWFVAVIVVPRDTVTIVIWVSAVHRQCWASYFQK